MVLGWMERHLLGSTSDQSVFSPAIGSERARKRAAAIQRLKGRQNSTVRQHPWGVGLFFLSGDNPIQKLHNNTSGR